MNKVRTSQEKIYKELFEKHKGTPMMVSSESLAHKALRFEMISNIFKDDNNFSVHDVGMGVADLYNYLSQSFSNKNIKYSGSEILEEYVNESSHRFPELQFYHRDLSEKSYDDHYDYIVMSGVFHQRRDTKIKDWEKFAQELLRNSFKMAKKGIAFNFISPFVDFYQTEVYYCNLFKLLNFINDDLSRFFEVKHNYALFEFTVFVYNPEFIKSSHPQAEFQKYFP